jgi:hypothetical protein
MTTTRKFRRLIGAGASLVLAVVFGALAGCQSNGSGDHGGLYLSVGLETAIGTLISLEQTGALPLEGADFIDATLGYGGSACKILADPVMTPEEKRLAITTDLTAQRAAFDRAFSALAGSGLDRGTMLVVVPAINGARAAVRIALTEDVDPARYERACATVAALAQSWVVQRAVTA